MMSAIAKEEGPFEEMLPRIEHANDFRIGIIHGRDPFDEKE